MERVEADDRAGDRARFTGYTIDGGFAEETLAEARYCSVVPAGTRICRPLRCCAPA